MFRLSNQTATSGLSPSIVGALVSALISAVVSFLIVWIKMYVLDPKQRASEQRVLREQLIMTWIAHMKNDKEILSTLERRLEKLTIDDRPLDRLAMGNYKLVERMMAVRSRILALNRRIELYDATMGPQLNYLVMANPLRENVPMAQLNSGESETARRVQGWRDEYLASLDSQRKSLLAEIEQLLKLLPETPLLETPHV